jgi:tetrahydromethanopterin:alpha-L-glutamate ligase
MTSLVALVSGFGWHVADLKRAAKHVGVSLHAIPFPSLIARVAENPPRLSDRKVRGGGDRDLACVLAGGGHDLSSFDGVLVRMMPPGSLEQVVFRMDALHQVAAAGVPVLNPPRAVETAVDKYLTLAKVEAAGLPVPATWVGESATAALEAFDGLGGDVVVKPLFGSEGHGLVRLSDKELAWRTFHALERLGSVLYLQRVVRHPGYDVRVFVLRGRVIGCMRRHAQPGEWRTNISLGGHAEPFQLDPETERLALAAARSVGAHMAGVDLIPDLERGHLVVLEVNAVPGWRALTRVTGVDVAASILVALKEMGHEPAQMSADLESSDQRTSPEPSALTPGRLAQVACLLEVSARKAGNVHRFDDLAGLHFVDFLLSAAAIVEPLDRARTLGLGRAIYDSIEATRRVVSTNTNLGMVLLLTPLAAVPAGEDLVTGVERVLAATTVDDARLVYGAIRLAQPGGLGEVSDQDVANQPTITLRAAMILAAERDSIARQYANGFRDVLGQALAGLRRYLQSGRPLETAIVSAFLDLLASNPDSLIARKHGQALASEVSRRAGEILAAGWPERESARQLFAEFDARLRRPDRPLNPGTTADLITAALYAALREGTIRLPFAQTSDCFPTPGRY